MDLHSVGPTVRPSGGTPSLRAGLLESAFGRSPHSVIASGPPSGLLEVHRRFAPASWSRRSDGPPTRSGRRRGGSASKSRSGERQFHHKRVFDRAGIVVPAFAGDAEIKAVVKTDGAHVRFSNFEN